MLIIILTLFALTACSSVEQSSEKLIYNKAAENWNEALPIGNGKLGAMIFGTLDEHLQLNDNTLYSGEPSATYLLPNIEKEIKHVIQLLKNKKYKEADDYVTKNMLGRIHQSYQPLGDIHIDFGNDAEISNYSRELDITKAVSAVTYTQKQIKYSREYFASNPDSVIVMRFKADGKGNLNFLAKLSSVHPNARQSVVDGKTISMKGKVPGFVGRRTLEHIEAKGDQYKYPELYNKNGTRKEFAKQILYDEEVDNKGTSFDARLSVLETDGEVISTDEGLEVQSASYAVVVFSNGTSFSGFDKSPSREGFDVGLLAQNIINKVSQKNYSTLYENHVKDYKSLYDRVSISLGENPEQKNLPTNERIKNFSASQDHSVAALLFQYGRYLMISGSRGNGQPLNLQGLWNHEVIPPWSSGYTININTEMNYWPAEVTNLSECTQPLFRLIKETSVNGKKVAQNMYGNRGWVSHHNVDIWRHAGPIDNQARFSFWPMSSGWFCSHLWEHYLFTNNKEFLKTEAYPLMKGAAEFYIDWLIELEDGYLVTPISTSPENMFLTEKNEEVSVSMGCTMDMAIIRELFTNTLEAAKVLNVDQEFQNELSQKIPKLLPYKIGAAGQIQEWMYDYKEQDPQHRHLSHLYGLHPGNQISPNKTPDLFEAARRTLEIRGDFATGWSMGWKINFWARMLDGDHAYKIIQNFIRPIDVVDEQYEGGGVYNNLLCAHPPFQIDGNLGYTAGVAEMLLQSQENSIHLLPALPSVWKTGFVKGLKARGNFEVDIYWENGKLTKAEILSVDGGDANIVYGEKSMKVNLKSGEKYTFK